MKISLYNATWLLIMLTSVTLVGTYAYERFSSTDNYFEFYGHVIEKDTFNAPEEIRSFTFGATPDDAITPLDFNNQLWCAPLGSELRRKLLHNRIVHLDYSFGHSLEGLTLAKHDEHTFFPAFSQDEINMVRTGDEYRSWSMAQLKPEFDAECHISTTITAHTTVFNLEKVVRTRGPSFDYITGVEYVGTDYDGVGLDTGNIETVEEVANQIRGIRTNRLNEHNIKYEQQTPKK